MRDYPLGVHADTSKLGEITRNGDLPGMDAADRWAHEYHFDPKDKWGLRPVYFGYLGFYIGTGQRFCINGYQAQTDFVLNDAEFPSLAGSDKYTIRVEVDSTGASRVITVIFNNYIDPAITVDASAYEGTLSKKPSNINDNGSGDYLIRLLVMQVDLGNGWEDAHVFDPAQVRDGSGQLVPRGDASAETGANGKIYDLLSTVTFESAVVDSTAFPAVYDIVDVNSGAIELGQSFTVQMSNAITVDDVYFQAKDETGNEYHPTFSVSGDTITGSVPLVSDDTLPMFGTMTVHVVSGVDAFTKNFEFTAPSGHTLVTLQDPVELDRSSYTYDKPINPAAGDFYFHESTADFSITENNVWQPSGDAPWSHAVWYLSAAGLRETEAVDGHGVQNQNPIANAGTRIENVAPGALVQLNGSGSSDPDGTVVRYEWEQIGGGTPVTLTGADTANASFTAPTLTDAESLEFQLTVTDDKGATATATVFVDVQAIGAPVVTLIAPDSIAVPEAVTLDATVTTDPENQNCTYLWSVDSTQPGAAVTSPDAKTASFDSDGLVTEQVVFTLLVTDENGQATETSKAVEIQRLSIELTGPADALQSKQQFTPALAITSPNGGDIIEWTVPAGFTIDDAGSEFPIISAPTVSNDASFEISVTVTDSAGITSEASFTVSVLKAQIVTAEMIDILHFELIHDQQIQAIANSLNREVLKWQLAEEDRDRVPAWLCDENWYLYLDLPGIDRIEIESGAMKISSADGSAGPLRIYNRIEAHAKTGDLVAVGPNTIRTNTNLTLASILYLDGVEQGYLLTATKTIPTASAKAFSISDSAAA